MDINGEKQPLKIYASLPKPPVKLLSGGCPECRIKERRVAELEGMKRELDKWVIADIYYSPGCSTCENFIDSDIPQVSNELDRQISINRHNILEANSLEDLEKRIKKRNIALKEFPILIYGEMVLQGEEVNGENFAKLITEESIKRGPAKGYIPGIKYLKPLPILLAGLIDGVNPCAFTTLIFLISTLFYIGKGKKEILQIGLIFSGTIFFSYYLVGLGLLNIVRTASFFPIVGDIIKYILVVALLIFSILSLYDVFLIKKGKEKQMKLQLPKSLKKRIHKTIRVNTRTRGLVLGTVIIGLLVTIFELACTGQIYLPIIAYIIKIEGSLSAYLYLTLYNLGFIIPLLAVFLLIYRGITNSAITNWFQSKLILIKVLLALLFMVMLIILLN